MNVQGETVLNVLAIDAELLRKDLANFAVLAGTLRNFLRRADSYSASFSFPCPRSQVVQAGVAQGRGDSFAHLWQPDR